MTAPRISHPTGEANFSMVTVSDVTYWFSYETCIAVERNGVTYVHRNDWGTITGKHINAVDGGGKEARDARLSATDFTWLLGWVDSPMDL